MRRLLAVVLVLAASGAFYAFAIVPNLAPKRFAEVEPGVLYRSGEGSPAAVRHVVEANQIKTIVDLGAHEPDSFEEELAERTANALGVRRVRLNLYGDAQGDPNDYLRALRIANDPANQPVLVHCGAGAQRTGCFVALQRNIVDGWALDDAYFEATQHGHDPDDPGSHVREMLDLWAAPIADAYRNGTDVAGWPPESASEGP